ncbi:MAG TPA: biotin/lipoyl-containing protein [Vicinamibacteria bacterium]|jgi:biotin carboxyl carrier protein|nr:biotin/lipoyl-containing protein [Vicinamibacteria bacterium]
MNFEATADGRTLRVEVRAVQGRYQVTLDGRSLEVDFQETPGGFVSLLIGGTSYEAGLVRRPGGYTVVLPDDVIDVELAAAARGAAPVRKAAGGLTEVRAPMPGRIVKVMASAGDDVTAGQGLVVMEAMKMENELRSPRPGRVKEIHVRERQTVETGALLAVVG